MTYSPVRTNNLARRPVALSGIDSATKPVLVMLGIGAVVGLGYLIYSGNKREREIRKTILDKEGSTGLARYEDAKTKRAAVVGGLGILSGLTNGGSFRHRLIRNKKKSRRSSRRLRANRANQRGLTFEQWYYAAGRPKVDDSQVEYAVMRLRDDWAAGVDPRKYRSLTRNTRRRTSRRRTSRR